MSDTKWTPGPWFYEPEDRGDDSVGMAGTPPYIYADPQSDGNAVPVCTMDSPCRATDRELVNEYDEGIEWIGDDKANARLIAAAPELYESLADAEIALAHLQDSLRVRVNPPTLEKARAALAKARGE
jgi:hypothetical protein